MLKITFEAIFAAGRVILRALDRQIIDGQT